MSAREDSDSTSGTESKDDRRADTGLRVVRAMPSGQGSSGEAAHADTEAGRTPTVSPTHGDAAGGGVTVSAPDEDVEAPPQVWLPVAEAAERTSVSESALRKWIKAGELATREAPGPRGLRTEVTVQAVVARAKLAGIDASPRAGLDLADAFTRLENLTGQLIAMSDRAARAEVERDHVKRRLDEIKLEQSTALEGERRRAESERARGDGLMGELASSREALTAERARADAMLAAVPRRKRHLFERPASGIPGDRTVSAQDGAVSAR